MYYYHGSEVLIEWTAQHACGTPAGNTECQIIVQYMCESDSEGLRDGKDENNARRRTAGGQGNNAQDANLAESLEISRGQHETYDYYNTCRLRERNKGLYTADQNMNNNKGAAATRQNNNGGRNGLECPEERDYYPYWHPTPWRDTIVFTSDAEKRCAYYRNESQNVASKGSCDYPIPAHLNESAPQEGNRRRRALLEAGEQLPNNPEACLQRGGQWITQGAWGIDPPLCRALPQSRDNHHGNIATGKFMGYTWIVPEEIKDGDACVLRIRYNMSSGDFNKAPGSDPENPTEADELWDPFNDLDSGFNGADSPLKNNPKSDFVGLESSGPIQLQVNTAQFGRTFQDRSHAFIVKKRPADIPDDARIVNFNVRGRRGNIVQVYPSVEYDFVPQELSVEEGTYLHFQWTGSDANAKGNAGNGKAGTDRSNLVQVADKATTQPLPIEKHTLFYDAENEGLSSTAAMAAKELIVKMAYLDQDKHAESVGNMCPKYCPTIRNQTACEL